MAEGSASAAGRLTTHVLDTMAGRPGSDLTIELFRVESGKPVLIKAVQTNADGRCDAPLLAGAEMVPGTYELVFHVGSYFRRLGVVLPDPAFLDSVPVRFGIADSAQHYHVPLLISPYSYSTYRGS